MLHLISQLGLAQEVVERIAAGDDVVLQQGALWAVWAGHTDNAKIFQLLARPAQVYVLQELLTVNGIGANDVLAGVQIINYAGLVDLSVINPVIHTWC
ncbi:hypothetical protein KEF85_03210 [Methylomonas paludis]|uniref:Uncharacterized protein n=1 Tax=Methylomonas paludis TaxID=1173101 RepID=A0A975MPC1_9GAMM|nr:DsrH/TusB family sulfur relay protein [Methylomonas paludis]QWF71502.1 hypothetical protein KEF85_03210 [Methylomonas paludis]